MLTNVAKAALIVAGAGFGLMRGLRLLDGLADHSAALQALEERIDGIQSQITMLHSRDEKLQASVDRAVTKEDLSAALDKALARVEAGVNARFGDQERSVDALRAMVGQTDEMLERLLDRLESARTETELQGIGT